MPLNSSEFINSCTFISFLKRLTRLHPHVVQEEIYSTLIMIYLTLVLPEPAASTIIIPLAIVSGFVQIKEVFQLFEHLLSYVGSVCHDLHV